MTDIHPLETWPEINDCPFCGADARNFELNFNNPFNPKLNDINCMDCGAQSPIWDTPEDAIHAWNEPLDIMVEMRKEIRDLQHDVDCLSKDCDRLRRELDECQGVIR